MATAAGWIERTHPTYDTLQPTWQLLQEVYRGDGGFLDGSALIAHPREVIYSRLEDGTPTKEALGYRDKYLRRRALARYENLARTIIDTYIAHLFAKSITRKAETLPELVAWWEDVDGAGQAIGPWMQAQQTLAMVYGHVVTVMDLSAGAREQPVTRAEQGRPVLRCYTPLDVLDWIWADGAYQALKVVEAVPRDALDEVTEGDSSTTGDGAPSTYEYVVWTPEDWTRYDSEGAVLDTAPHGFGCVPAVLHAARPVPGLAGIGASTLGDPRLFRDHFNLVSELRELLRAQTFSMLNIQLGQDEEVGAARARLGEAASTETIVWSKGTAGFIAPPDGPAQTYQQELLALERKLYRLAGLPWEGDAAGAESADSRRLKAMDLNRLLAMYAEGAENAEYAFARLWVRATRGLTEPAAITAALKDVTIQYPDEFATIDTTQAAADVRDVQTMNLGPTATAEARKRGVQIVLPDLAPGLQQTIDGEIETAARAQANPQTRASGFRARVTAAAPVTPEGLSMAEGDEDGTQLQDAGARA